MAKNGGWTRGERVQADGGTLLRRECKHCGRPALFGHAERPRPCDCWAHQRPR